MFRQPLKRRPRLLFHAFYRAKAEVKPKQRTTPRLRSPPSGSSEGRRSVGTRVFQLLRLAGVRFKTVAMELYFFVVSKTNTQSLLGDRTLCAKAGFAGLVLQSRTMAPRKLHSLSPSLTQICPPFPNPPAKKPPSC